MIVDMAITMITFVGIGVPATVMALLLARSKWVQGLFD